MCPFPLRAGPSVTYITLFLSFDQYLAIPSHKGAQGRQLLVRLALYLAKKITVGDRKMHTCIKPAVSASIVFLPCDVLCFWFFLRGWHLGKWLACILFCIHPWDGHKDEEEVQRDDPTISFQQVQQHLLQLFHIFDFWIGYFLNKVLPSCDG